MSLPGSRSKCLLCGAILEDDREAGSHLRAVHQIVPGEETLVGDPFVPAPDLAPPTAILSFPPAATSWVGLAGPRQHR